MAVVNLLDLKLALGLDVTLDGDDYELQTKIDAAEAEYAEHVRPLPGSYTRTGMLPLFLPRDVTTVTATVGAGSSLPVVHDKTTGMVDGYGFYARAWAVTLTYTVGPVPDNHLEAITADIAEYWDRTQRDVAVERPGFNNGPDFDRAVAGGRPVTMWPRIRALAGPVVV